MVLGGAVEDSTGKEVAVASVLVRPMEEELSDAEGVEEVSVSVSVLLAVPDASELDSLLEGAEAVDEEGKPGKVVYSVSVNTELLDSSGVSELVELPDVMGESDVEELSEVVDVGKGVSMVPESVVKDSDGVSEGLTKLLVLEVIDSV
jgi:hypothetical protein